MIIYFEDEVISETYQLIPSVHLYIDAGWGFSKCEKFIEKAKCYDKKINGEYKIYTNYLPCLNQASWKINNNHLWETQIFLRDKNNEWKNIQEFTERELRPAYNIMKLYMNGEFMLEV